MTNTYFPCQCGHKFSDHFEIEFRKRESDWPCRICITPNGGCIDYKSISNLEYLEQQYERSTK